MSKKRRAFDCAVALFALAALSPLLGLCWVLVRCTSRGPALFRQRRMGRHGQEFVLHKFRSMRVSDTSHGPSHTVHNDRRITPVGFLLRRFKLDELPQFWNVLKGDMSLVGPRPKLPHHEGLLMSYRPGLTGRATLAFRHEERMLLEVPAHEVDHFYEAVVKPIKAELDIRYMESATFLSDVKVLLNTMFRCLDCTVDARGELDTLMGRHAPEHMDRLHAKPQTAKPVKPMKTPSMVPESSGEQTGDLDDVA
jgi:lipopolysaccharide/colanic/teichoic acid biosynthesis glycosyltransferase